MVQTTLKVSTDKKKQPNWDKKIFYIMALPQKMDRFEVGFSHLFTGEFRHKTYSEASAGLVIQV